MPSAKELAVEKDNALWLSQLAKVCEQHFAELYRGSGAKLLLGKASGEERRFKGEYDSVLSASCSMIGRTASNPCTTWGG